MKVAFLFMGMPVGGAEDFAITVSRQPRFAGRARFEFVCLRELGVLGEQLRSEGGKVVCLPVAKTKRFSLLGLWRLSRWLRRQRIDLVHSQTYHAHTYAVAAARLAKVPVILHQQKTLEKMKPRRAWVLKNLMRWADGVIALSERTVGDIHRVFGVEKERLFVLPNLVDRTEFSPMSAQARGRLREELGLPIGRFLIGTVASLNEVKNHGATIEMARALREAGLDFEVRIFGEGKDRGSLQAKIEKAGLRDRVILAGNQRPVHPWVKALDLFVLPSFWEGQSLALLQAVAADIPVIASEIEGNVAVLGEAHPGLFKIGEEIRYEQLVKRAMDEEVFRRELRESQRRIELPYADEVAEELATLYFQVMKRFQSGK